MVSEASTQIFQRALSLIRVERVFDALPLLSQLIEAEPGWAEVYVQRARVRKRLGDGERAIADYAQAIRLDPKAETYLARALVWLELKQVKGVIADSRQAVALQPQLAGGHRVLGKALGLLGDGKGAIAAYKQAARCYLDAKDKANAQKCIDAIEPLKALPEYSLRERYANDRPSGTALTSTDKNGLATTDIPATPEAFLQRLESLYDAGEDTKTLAELNWFLQIYPQDVQALALRGVVQARLGHRAEAIADMAAATKFQAELTSARGPDVNDIRFRRGQMRRALSDCDGAIEEFSALIEAAGAAQKPVAKYFAQRGD
ncbi:MAG: tetratricopeptide repeat protein, partial [Cyanobacteria bacterium J06576_12]